MVKECVDEFGSLCCGVGAVTRDVLLFVVNVRARRKIYVCYGDGKWRMFVCVLEPVHFKCLFIIFFFT